MPELVGLKETEFALSPERLQLLVSALHSSMLQAVDMMGVGGNVPVLDNDASDDQKSITGFSSARIPAPMHTGGALFSYSVYIVLASVFHPS